MAGFNAADKLRRSVGKGQVLPADVLARKLKAFDRDGDGALEHAELVEFFRKNRAGGPWFCKYLANTMWKLFELWYAGRPDSIKIEGLARLLHTWMAEPPPPKKRMRITPEGMQGYERLQSLEEYEAEQNKSDSHPRPRRSSGGPSKPGRPGPRPLSGPSRPARPGPRRPGPRK